MGDTYKIKVTLQDHPHLFVRQLTQHRTDDEARREHGLELVDDKRDPIDRSGALCVRGTHHAVDEVLQERVDVPGVVGCGMCVCVCVLFGGGGVRE